MTTREKFQRDPDHRIVFHFTPKHASWLNQIEMWFSILARKVIRHGILGAVARHIRTHGVEEDAFIDVADSAMVTEANLEQAGERIRFVTRLPATSNEHEGVILRAIEADDWTEVGKIAQTPSTEHRPGASYRVSEGSVILYGKRYRAAVVHSSAHDKRRLKRLERELQASRSEASGKGAKTFVGAEIVGGTHERLFERRVAGNR